MPPVAPVILMEGRSLDVEQGRVWPSDSAMPDIKLPLIGDWLSIRWRESYPVNSIVSVILPVQDLWDLTAMSYRGFAGRESSSLEIARRTTVYGPVVVFAGRTGTGLLLLTTSDELYDLFDLEVGRLTAAPLVAEHAANVAFQAVDAGAYLSSGQGFFASEANSPKIKIPQERWLLVQLNFGFGLRSYSISNSLHVVDGFQLRSLEPASYSDVTNGSNALVITEITGVNIGGKVEIATVRLGRTADGYLLLTSNWPQTDIRLFKLSDQVPILDGN